MHDVAIVGGGPAGCHTAYQLAREGFDVLVLEKDGTSQQPPVCTGVLGLEAFEKFDLPRESILSHIKEIRFVSPSGQLFPFRPMDIQAYVVDRLTFNQGMRRRAIEAGAVIRERTACSDINVKKTHVELNTSSNGGHVQARAAVLACGHNPDLTRKLHLGAVAECYEGAQTELHMEDLCATEIYVGRNVAPSSFAWAVKLTDSRARVGLVTKRGASRYLRTFLGSPFMKGRIKEATSVLGKAIPFGTLERTFSDRLIAVGEVAGQVKTTTHGGVYYGLIGAQAAAETLTGALQRDELSGEALHAYEKRWRELLEPELQRGQFLRKLFERLSDSQIDRLFSLALKDGVMDLVHRKARFDWHGELIASLMEHTALKHLRNWL